jgi:hypothetical protein
MTNEDVIITSSNTIEAVIDAAGVVSVQLDKTGYTENEASVMAGKAAIAAAIKKQGIGANKDDSFSTLSDKISRIENGSAVGGINIKYLTDNDYYDAYIQIAKPNVEYISSEIVI